METKNLTIMFIDLAGYTIRSSKMPRERFLELLDSYEKIMEPIFDEFHGVLIKKIGDAFLVAFESPTNAILCGIQIQDTLFKYNKRVKKEDRLRVRIAINTGEVQIRDNDVYGEAVNIASRLEEVATTNDVYFTETVYLSMNKAEIPAIFIGEKKFKGIPRKINVYKVLGKYSQILLKRRKKKLQQLKRRRALILAISIIIMLILLFMAFYAYLSFNNLRLF